MNECGMNGPDPFGPGRKKERKNQTGEGKGLPKVMQNAKCARD